MSDFINKSIFLKGNLSDINSILSYPLTRVDFGKSTWLLCVKDIAYENKTNENFSYFGQIECNLVRDFRDFQKSSHSYMPNIASFLLKATSREKKIVYFEKSWFLINTPNDTVKLFFKSPVNGEPINLNCDVYVTLLLKAI